VVLAALGAGLPARAAFQQFPDAGSWSAAAGSIIGGEDFEAFASDVSFDGLLVTLDDGMAIGTLVAAGAGDNEIDAPPVVSPQADVNGTAHANVFNGEVVPTTPFITFATPITAFGAVFKNINDEVLRTIVDLFDGAVLLDSLAPPVAPNDTVGFWSFASDSGQQVTEIRFRRVNDDIFGIDDIEIGSSELPEPDTLALLVLGLVGLRVILARIPCGRRLELG
jgi:hypothetical protein